MTRDAILSLLDLRLSALQRRDLNALMELYADTCVVDSPLGGHASGHEAIRRVWHAWLGAFKDAEFTFEPPVIDGDRVAQLAMVSGTDTGGFMGLPPTGKHFEMPLVLLYTVSNGRFQTERRIYDFTGLLVQLGVLKAKPA